jgi:hypothetical protein
MSAPGSRFTCTNCDFQTEWHPGRGAYVYGLRDGTTVYAPRGLGWCAACRTIQDILLGLSPAVLQDECAIRRKRLPAKRLTVWSRLLGQREDSATARNRYRLEEKEKFLSVLAGRKSVSKCVRCGSTNVALIERPFLKGIEKQPLPYIHPGCIGQLMISETEYSFNFKRVPDTSVIPAFK